MMAHDLVIISAQLTDREEARMLSVAGKTPAWVLDGMTLAADLLDQVKQRLLDTAGNSSGSTKRLSVHNEQV
jgi:hypothetical protein